MTPYDFWIVIACFVAGCFVAVTIWWWFEEGRYTYGWQKPLELIGWYWALERMWRLLPDKCEVRDCCRKGVRGNENVITGEDGKRTIMCDYCTAIWMQSGLRQARPDRGPLVTWDPVDTSQDHASPAREFCEYCGAGIGEHRREGEGTCSRCDPDGCSR